MDKICLLIAYDGRWDTGKNYVDHKTRVILVEYGITYGELMGNICEDLKLIKNKIEFEVWFDLKVPNCKGMLLTSDKDVGTCLYLVKNDPAYKKSLFVVDIVKDGGKTDLVVGTSNTFSLLQDVIEQNNDDSTISMDFQVPMIENETSLTAMEVVPLPITVVQHKNPKRRENEEEDDDLIRVRSFGRFCMERSGFCFVVIGLEALNGLGVFVFKHLALSIAIVAMVAAIDEILA